MVKGWINVWRLIAHVKPFSVIQRFNFNMRNISSSLKDNKSLLVKIKNC